MKSSGIIQTMMESTVSVKHNQSQSDYKRTPINSWEEAASDVLQIYYELLQESSSCRSIVFNYIINLRIFNIQFQHINNPLFLEILRKMYNNVDPIFNTARDYLCNVSPDDLPLLFTQIREHVPIALIDDMKSSSLDLPLVIARTLQDEKERIQARQETAEHKLKYGTALLEAKDAELDRLVTSLVRDPLSQAHEQQLQKLSSVEKSSIPSKIRHRIQQHLNIRFQFMSPESKSQYRNCHQKFQEIIDMLERLRIETSNSNLNLSEELKRFAPRF